MERYMMILKAIRRMPPELQQALRENVYPISVTKNQILQTPTGVNDCIYIIEKGLFHYYMLEKGGQRTLDFRWEDQFINTLKPVRIIDGEPQDGIEALEDGLIWCMPGELIKDLSRKHLLFNFHYQEILIRDHLLTKQSLRFSLPGLALEHFRSLYQLFPGLAGRIPIQYLASFTGIPEKKLKHLLDSEINLLGNLRRRRRRPPDGL